MNACPSGRARRLHAAERTPGSRGRGRRVRWTAQPARRRPCPANVPAPDDRPVRATIPAAPRGARPGAPDARARVPRRRRRPRHRQPARRDPRRSPRSSPPTSASPPTCGPTRGCCGTRPTATYRMVSALLELARTRPLAGSPDRDRARACGRCSSSPPIRWPASTSRSTCRPTFPTRTATRRRCASRSRRRWSRRSRPWAGPTPRGRLRVSGSMVTDDAIGARRILEAGGRDGRREPGGDRPSRGRRQARRSSRIRRPATGRTAGSRRRLRRRGRAARGPRVRRRVVGARPPRPRPRTGGLPRRSRRPAARRRCSWSRRASSTPSCPTIACPG